MTITIATANSRMDKIWKNQEISWEDFCTRCSNTRRTEESVEEYKAMTKAQQDNIKDVGGFVGGFLKEGRRRTGFVVYHSMLTLDMDYAEPGIWGQIELLYDFTCLVYSTHKHTPEHPRLRLIVPLQRNVTPNEYIAVSRMLAKIIGIEQFDDTTYEPTRLMYWPSTSSNGQFFFEQQSGTPLDPDEILAKYHDWHDTAEWPVSSRQSQVVKRQMSRQQDPMEKPGIIGAFCRTYDIPSVLSHYLSEVYEPSKMEGRFDYIPADSSAGLVVYDDKFAYSHHATDPACGMLLNSFDLVRHHRFHALDDDAKPDTPVTKLPSYNAMEELAAKDGAVLTLIDQERQEQLKLEFANPGEWMQGLERDKMGSIKPTDFNLNLIMEHDEHLKGIVFNQLADGMEIKGDVPWYHPAKFWRDQDDAQLTRYLTLNYAPFTKRSIDTIVTAVADDRSYHPIKAYLGSLPEWDKMPRVDTLLIDFLDAPDTQYTRAVTRKMLCAAVLRVRRPGIKFDTMLVMNGPQGIGKSTLIAKLAGEWFSDSLNLQDTHDKTAAEKLQGYWLLEIAELNGLRKAEVETLRSFLSRQNDIYRASYGRRATPHFRQCVFYGTTNAESGYLRDVTGNRRFWPVLTPRIGKRGSWELTQQEVDQIWAEVLVLVDRGESIHLTGELLKDAEKEQCEAMEIDEREGLVREYLDTLLPENWQAMELYERRNYLNGSDFGELRRNGTILRDSVSNMEIWCECFGRDRALMSRRDSGEIQAIMARIEGWSSPKFYARTGIYGRQRSYRRTVTDGFGRQ